MESVSFIPQFGSALATIAAFVVALSVVVSIHEYGHYIIGRLSGIKADVFSLGFGPVLLARVDRHGTRWQLAALPFGGYVKFRGDSDAASAQANLSAIAPADRRSTMHGAPLWARAATVAAGPLFNFASAILIFAGMALWSGVASEEPVVGAVKPVPFQGAQLQEGDRILGIADRPTPDLATLLVVAGDLAPSPSVPYLVERDGVHVTFDGPFISPPVVNSVQPQTAAFDAGILEGDVVTAVNGTQVFGFTQLRELVGASDGKPLTLTIWRAGATFETVLTPRRMDIPKAEGGFETRWLIGLTGDIVFDPLMRRTGWVESIEIGISQSYFIAKTSLSGIWHMVTGAISSCNLRGPLGIAESSGAAASQGTESFIFFIAMLSVAVGLMNLFPIPILDGGHLVFYAYEAVFRRPPSERILRVLMASGLAILATMMIFAVTNDLFCP